MEAGAGGWSCPLLRERMEALFGAASPRLGSGAMRAGVEAPPARVSWGAGWQARQRPGGLEQLSLGAYMEGVHYRCSGAAWSCRGSRRRLAEQ